MSNLLRCPFCEYAAKNESAVTTSRLLAIHLTESHLDIFHELAAHVSSELDLAIGTRLVGLRHAGKVERLDEERLARAIEAADAHEWDLGGAPKWAAAIAKEYAALGEEAARE